MKTTLCFDFGNTRLKCGVFKGSVLTQVIVLPDDSRETLQKLLTDYLPEKIILSSVIDHNVEFERTLATQAGFHKISIHTKLPFTAPVSKPESIGADRIALAAAAVFFIPEKIILLSAWVPALLTILSISTINFLAAVYHPAWKCVCSL